MPKLKKKTRQECGMSIAIRGNQEVITCCLGDGGCRDTANNEERTADLCARERRAGAIACDSLDRCVALLHHLRE